MEKIDTGTDQLLVEKEDGVATITLNRPQARNALSTELTPALRRMISQLAEDQDVGVLLITGAGSAFCAGGDIKGMGNLEAEDRSIEDRVEDLRLRQRTLTGALVAVRKPTIAALPGPAAGAGLALALACDIRIAVASAFVTTGYIHVGLSGDYGIAALLTRTVGTARARELMFTGDRVNSERCEKLGIFNRVVTDGALRETAFEMALSIASGPRQALGFMKDNLEEALKHTFEESLDGEASRLIQSALNTDHREAVTAFIEKRRPNFKKYA